MGDGTEDRTGTIEGLLRSKLHAEHEARKKADADAAAMRAALKDIAQEQDRGRHDGLPEAGPLLDAEIMWAIARAALASDAGKAMLAELEELRKWKADRIAKDSECKRG